MNKLWSPWRSQYIDSFKTEEQNNNDCVLCELAKNRVEDEKSLVVNKSALTFTVLNLYPYNNGHLMIVPFRHTSDFSSLSNEESIEIMNELKTAEKALKIISKPEGFNVGLNLGRVAGAGIHEHIHFHIVPRWNGDTNFMPVLGEVKVISQDLLKTKSELVKVYSELKAD